MRNRLAVTAVLGGLLAGLVLAEGEGADQGVLGPPSPPTGAGYVVVEGAPGVFAGYVEAPGAVVSPDRSRRSSAPRRVCAWFDFASETSFAKTTPAAMRGGFTYLLACFEAGTGTLVYADFRIWQPGQTGGGVVTTLDEVVAFARSLLDLPAPEVVTAPPPARLIVGLSTWLGHPPVANLTVHAQAGPLWASAEARPISVTYDFGDGTDPLTCTPVPAPPDPRGAEPSCAQHTYRFHGNYPLTVTITYEIWVTTGDNETGVVTGPALADTVTSPPAVIATTARELQAVIH